MFMASGIGWGGAIGEITHHWFIVAVIGGVAGISCLLGVGWVQLLLPRIETRAT